MKYSLYLNESFIQSADAQGHLMIKSTYRMWQWINPMGVEIPLGESTLSIREGDRVISTALFGRHIKKLNWKVLK